MYDDPGFWGYVKSTLRRWTDFRGRSRRKEFWYFSLFLLILSMAAGLAVLLLENTLGVAVPEWPLNVLGLLLLFPHLAVSVRRLHDAGKSGLWIVGPWLLVMAGLGLLLVNMSGLFPSEGTLSDIFVVLWIGSWVAVFAVMALTIIFTFLYNSQPGTNRYGPNPKGIDSSGNPPGQDGNAAPGNSGGGGEPVWVEKT